MAQRLLLQEGWLRQHLTETDMHRYVAGLTRLGGALNALPTDFYTELSQGREGTAQQEVQAAVAELRPVVSKLGGGHYGKILDDLLEMTTVDRIGQAVASAGDLGPRTTRTEAR